MRSRSRDAGRPGGAHTPPDVARGKKGPGRRRDHIRKNYVVTSEKNICSFPKLALDQTHPGRRPGRCRPARGPAGRLAGGLLVFRRRPNARLREGRRAGLRRRGRRQSRVRRVGLLPRAPARLLGRRAPAQGRPLRAVRRPRRALRRLVPLLRLRAAGSAGRASASQPASSPAPRASPPSRSPSSRRACYGQWEIGQLVVFTLALTRHLGVHRRGLPARLPRDLPARGPALQHPLDRVPLVPDGPAVGGRLVRG